MFLFKEFTKKVKIAPSEVSIDNIIFKLHYRVTFWFLLGCTVIVSSKQFIKDHIDCISDHSVSNVINTFCFFSTTFTVNRLHNDSYLPGTHVVSSGVGHSLPGEEVKYHNYYQWVPFVLFGQAMAFYFPHTLWKHLERGRMRSIVAHVKTSLLTADSDIEIKGHKIESDATKRKREKIIKESYLIWNRFKINRDWARHLVFCEFLNAVNICLQIYLVNEFLNGGFLNLGIRWLEEDDAVLEEVFPKVTKCTFHRYGPSGTIQQHDALCVMSLNIINDKIYTLLWFWFLALLVLTTLGLVWRLLTCSLHHRSAWFNRRVWGEVSPGPPFKDAEIEMIATKLAFSEWLLLYYIGRNMDSRMFRRVVAELSHALGRSLLTLRDSYRSNIGGSESFC